MDPAIVLRPTIDRAWLEASASREPIEHAYTLWDLDRFPDRIRTVSALRGEATIGYLLVWLGLPSVPIVHWHGRGPGTERLAEALPPRPLVAIVPPEVRDAVVAARGPTVEFPELLTVRTGGPVLGSPPSPGPVRRLGPSDGAKLASWARGQPDAQAAEYPALDLVGEAVWGAFDDGRLVGAARAAVRLPKEWVVAGVYVEPSARRRGHGRRLVAAIASDAAAAGARVGLYVREDRAGARRLYEQLGFRAVARRLWLDLGAGIEP